MTGLRRVLWAAAALASVARCGEEVHTYLEETDGVHTAFRWTLTREGKDCLVVSVSPKDTQTVRCTEDGTTREWTLKGKDGDVRCVLERGRVVLAGRFHGRTLRREFQLGDLPWYQALSVSLRQVAAKDRKEAVFWMLRPDNLQMIELKASYDAAEEVVVGKTKVAADRVRVSSGGLLGGAWHSFYWFRRSDRLFLRYEGIMGMPLLPKTVVELDPKAER